MRIRRRIRWRDIQAYHEQEDEKTQELKERQHRN